MKNSRAWHDELTAEGAEDAEKRGAGSEERGAIGSVKGVYYAVGFGRVEDAGGTPDFLAVAVEEDVGGSEAEAEAAEEGTAISIKNVNANDLHAAVPFRCQPIHDRL
jgi:hypothetical protein